MAELLKLNVLERNETGKGPNRRLRASGMVPGVYYDQHGVNIPVKVKVTPLIKIHSKLGGSQVFELVLDKDGKLQTLPSLIWRYKMDPVKPLPIHVDFFGVDLDKTLKVSVPFEIVGNSKGVKLGGVMELYRETIEVICKPMDIPESIVLDITEMQILDSIHIQDVSFPEGVVAQFDENFAVLAITDSHADEDDKEAGEKDEGEAKA